MDKKASLSKRHRSTAPALEMVEALGQSEAFLAFQERLSRVAPVNRPVLLMGERGTGKELAATRLHYLSNRWQAPLIALNCAALSPALVESELFGYEKGAFTGALQQRRGRFEAAEGGTLFLDEVGNIPIEVQEKILRVVEYNTFERVGSSRSIKVDVRIVAATNADLAAMSEKKRFKRDLLDRLSFEVLFLPPLRDRKGDISLLAEHFAARMAFEMERPDIPRFSRKALATLEGYDWPGNIRELKNVVERAVYRSDTRRITEITFDPFQSPFEERVSSEKVKSPPDQPDTKKPRHFPAMPFKAAVWQFKVDLLEKALETTRYNQKSAAALLGLTYHQFRGLYRQYRKRLK